MLKKTVFVFVVVFAQIFLFCDASIFAEEPEIRVTMKGKISNIADVGQYINAQTLLQLYP